MWEHQGRRNLTFERSLKPQDWNNFFFSTRTRTSPGWWIHVSILDWHAVPALTTTLGAHHCQMRKAKHFWSIQTCRLYLFCPELIGNVPASSENVLLTEIWPLGICCYGLRKYKCGNVLMCRILWVEAGCILQFRLHDLTSHHGWFSNLMSSRN